MALWNLKFVGTFTTLSPITVVAPNAEEVRTPDGGKYKRIVRRTSYESGLRVHKPVIPGSTFRGRLRRSATDIARVMGDGKVSLAEWHQNAVGGIKGADKEAGHDIMLRARAREANPVLALFGAGSPWMASRASIGDMVPNEVIDTDIVGGVRADDGKRDMGFFAKLDDGAADQWRAMTQANAQRTEFKAKDRTLNAQLRAARKAKNDDDIARLTQELADLERSAAEAELLAANPVSMPLQHEAMPLGVVGLHTMALSAVTAAEAGLFVAALNQMFKVKPALGQHENLGYGLVKVDYDVFLSPADDTDPFSVNQQPVKSIGTLSAEPSVGLSNVPDELIGFMAAFKDAFSSFDFRLVSDLEGV